MAEEKILIIEDEKLIRWSLAELLTKERYQVFSAEEGNSAIKLMDDESFDLILLDNKLPDIEGMDILRLIIKDYPDIPVIIMTAYGSVDQAVEAIKSGAYDYLNKPLNFDELLITIQKALETTRLRREISRIRQEQKKMFGLEKIIGRSPKIVEVFKLVNKVAKSAATTVLIQGESGTGKDLIAKAIHYMSSRADKPFVNITCSALPESLLETELMGYERGAFTDAKRLKKGLFEQADEGTIFLNEIGEIGLSLQVKLLRLIEEKSFKRVGGLKDIKVNVRIIAATNQVLRDKVQKNLFREDLYYRLKVIPIDMPPLREKREDIPLLINYFIDTFNKEYRKNIQGVSPEALKLLINYNWPGNVRELRNLIERAVILENKKFITPEDLPREIMPCSALETSPGDEFALPEKGVDLNHLEKHLIQQALTRTKGNKTKAARLLSISRDVLRYRIKKYNLEYL
jgi:two-component system response regulator AtoC